MLLQILLLQLTQLVGILIQFHFSPTLIPIIPNFSILSPLRSSNVRFLMCFPIRVLHDFDIHI
jgi:hypothetical protein